MALARPRMSADEFFTLPPLDQYRFAQLIDGELVVNYPKVGHQEIVSWLLHQISLWIDGEPHRGVVLSVAVHCSPYDVFIPDLVWLAPEHRPSRDAGYLQVAPDLVVEVRSPSTWHHDQGRKRQLYEEMGVAELWLVDDVAETIEVHRRSSPTVSVFDEQRILRSGDTLTTSLLPGFTLDVAALFSSGLAQ